MRRLLLVLLAAVLVTVAPACSFGGGTAEPEPTTEAETPSEVRSEIWERSYSECASNEIEQLSAQYRVAQDTELVAGAVGAKWAEFFGGGAADAVRAGKDGCLQGFDAE